MEWTRRSLMIAIAMYDGGTSKARYELYERIKECAWSEEVFYLSDVQPFLSPAQQQWLEETDFPSLEKQYVDAGIHFLMIEDELYPPRLRQIYLPPVVLFYKGDIGLLKKLSLGVVGARAQSPYAELAVKALIPGLVKKDVVIMSGMAKGVDSIAHQVTLAHRGKTIAVMGTGIDICYPRTNEALWHRIERRGLVLSEYPIGSGPMKFHFPYRNRIIAGLSHGVCVVEARMQSGSLITANVALTENRVIFAVPGNITSELSQGTNALIAVGAIPALEPQDILDEISYFD